MSLDGKISPATAHDLHPIISGWFDQRGWVARAHQLECLDAAESGNSYLLIAPTGGGKTLAGFLPTISEFCEPTAKHSGLHTLYISPLKALAVDIARNVSGPIGEMELPITIETRTGDTPYSKRLRQFNTPPNILLITPEQLALMLSSPEAPSFFQSLQCVILDELHALIDSKRGHLLGLGLARLRSLAPALRVTGLSATVPDPEPLLKFLTPQHSDAKPASLIRAKGGIDARVDILETNERIPWSGHLARHALREVYEAIKSSKMTLVFVNTRSQAEITFQSLWQANEDNLPIALHHGSLDVEQRRRVEAAMTRGALRAVVCTSTLDLGIDWGDIDLVIQIGAPKGASRLTQRIGRSNHRMDEPSRALLVPSNRLEVLECCAAQEAVKENAFDGPPIREGTLDVLCQHILGVACSSNFFPDDLYKEVTSVSLYENLDRALFDDALQFAATGGSSLERYDRYRRIVKNSDGSYRVRNAQIAHQYRMNVGTIVEAASINIKLVSKKAPKRAGRRLGTVEEGVIEQLAPGDTFIFAGEVLCLESVNGVDALVSRATDKSPRVIVWTGGKFPLSTNLADRVRQMMSKKSDWSKFPDDVREWLEIQDKVSVIPKPKELLVETFANAGRYFLVCYPFDGQLAHQTLGTLITKRLERGGLQPLGFVAGEYALSVWCRKPLDDLVMSELFDEDMLGDDLEEWLQQSVLMKRTFRNCAIIAGLIERRYPGQEKTGRQVAFSSDLIFDVLKEHDPNHILLKAAWADAASGFLDLKRLQSLLKRVNGQVNHVHLQRVSPLAIPVMLEINKQAINGEAQEAMLKEASDALIEQALKQ